MRCQLSRGSGRALPSLVCPELYEMEALCPLGSWSAVMAQFPRCGLAWLGSLLEAAALANTCTDGALLERALVLSSKWMQPLLGVHIEPEMEFPAAPDEAGRLTLS